MNAASMARVPLPHMGLMKWPLPFHPVAIITAAARVSCMGAVMGIFLYPRLDRGSPEVSKYTEQEIKPEGIVNCPLGRYACNGFG